MQLQMTYVATTRARHNYTTPGQKKKRALSDIPIKQLFI